MGNYARENNVENQRRKQQEVPNEWYPSLLSCAVVLPHSSREKKNTLPQMLFSVDEAKLRENYSKDRRSPFNVQRRYSLQKSKPHTQGKR
jgi:hypothetical protein